MFGVELNILDVDGHVDLSDKLLDKLDYAIASMHAQNYKSGSSKRKYKCLPERYEASLRQKSSDIAIIRIFQQIMRHLQSQQKNSE